MDMYTKISRQPYQIERRYQQTICRKPHSASRMVTWPMTKRHLDRSWSLTAIRLSLNISKSVGDRVSVPTEHGPLGCGNNKDYWVLRQSPIDELCMRRGQPKDEMRT